MKTIRSAIAAMIKKHGASVLAGRIEVSEALLNQWAEEPAENQKRTDIPLRYVILLTRVTDDSTLMQAIAAEAGGTVIQRESPEKPQTTESLVVDVIRLSIALAEKYTSLIKKGGIISRIELKEVSRLATRLQIVTADILEDCKEMLHINFTPNKDGGTDHANN